MKTLYRLVELAYQRSKLYNSCWDAEEPIWQEVALKVEEDIDKSGYALKPIEELELAGFGDFLRMGSTGVVVPVFDKVFKVYRVLKIARPLELGKNKIAAYLGEKPEIRNEWEILSRINHRHIIRVFYGNTLEIGKRQFPFYIMELIRDAIPGDEWIEAFSEYDKLNIGVFLRSVRAIFSAVGYIHGLATPCIVHFDIKPANILVSQSEGIKLIDFGFSKVVSIGDSRETGIQVTEPFAHPKLKELINQQIQNNQNNKDFNKQFIWIKRSDVSPAFDLYSLGITLLDFKRNRAVQGLFEENDYYRKYYDLIAVRLLDGYSPPRLLDGHSPPKGFECRSYDLPLEVWGEIKYDDTRSAVEDVERMTGNRSVDTGIPELNPYSTETVQIPGRAKVVLSGRVRDILNCREFKRLSNVTQLGPLNLVYPGATHKRREHSLGTYAMACEYIRALDCNVQDPFFRSVMRTKDRETLILAALLHDIGSYPMAHDMEDVSAIVFTHEAYSVNIIRGSITLPEVGSTNEQFRIKELLESGDWNEEGDEQNTSIVEGVARLISLNKSGSSFRERALRSIINSSIDCDKLDYLARDCSHVGVSYGLGIDLRRMLKCLVLTLRIQGDKQPELLPHIGVLEKGRAAAESIIAARYYMFSSVYWHKTYRAIKAMLWQAVNILLHLYDISPHKGAIEAEGSRQETMRKALGAAFEHMVFGNDAALKVLQRMRSVFSKGIAARCDRKALFGDSEDVELETRKALGLIKLLADNSDLETSDAQFLVLLCRLAAIGLAAKGRKATKEDRRLLKRVHSLLSAITCRHLYKALVDFPELETGEYKKRYEDGLKAVKCQHWQDYEQQRRIHQLRLVTALQPKLIAAVQRLRERNCIMLKELHEKSCAKRKEECESNCIKQKLTAEYLTEYSKHLDKGTMMHCTPNWSPQDKRLLNKYAKAAIALAEDDDIILFDFPKSFADPDKQPLYLVDKEGVGRQSEVARTLMNTANHALSTARVYCSVDVAWLARQQFQQLEIASILFPDE